MTSVLKDKSPLAGPYTRVDLLDGSTLTSRLPWELVVHSSGIPLAVTDGTFVIPWSTVRLLERPDERD